MKVIVVLMLVVPFLCSCPVWAEGDVSDHPLDNIQVVTSPEIIEARSKSFEKDLQSIGVNGVITNCKSMIDLPVNVRDGNNSYGAVCDITIDGKSKSLMICNDDMVGHFSISKDAIPSHDWVARFTHNNCYGG